MKITGLMIISGLIASLNEVVAATDAVITKRGEHLLINDVLSPMIIEAGIRLGKVFSLATAPEREEWLRDVNLRVGQWDSWVQNTVGHIADVEKYKKLHRWGVPELRKDCVECVARLAKYEPLVRQGAEEAHQRMLALLDE